MGSGACTLCLLCVFVEVVGWCSGESELATEYVEGCGSRIAATRVLSRATCTGMSYKVIHRWLPLMPGLEVPQGGSAVNPCWPPLVLGLGGVA